MNYVMQEYIDRKAVGSGTRGEMCDGARVPLRKRQETDAKLASVNSNTGVGQASGMCRQRRRGCAGKEGSRAFIVRDIRVGGQDFAKKCES